MAIINEGQTSSDASDAIEVMIEENIENNGAQE